MNFVPGAYNSAQAVEISAESSGNFSEQKQWKLEWQKRGGRAGEDWVLRTGIVVADENGQVWPLHVYLRRELTSIATDILSPTSPESVPAAWIENAINTRLVRAHMAFSKPLEMPSNYATLLSAAMLWGNFVSAVFALVETSLNPEAEKICIDAYTLGFVAPKYFSVKRASIPSAEPITTEYYAAITPDRQDKAWTTYADDGQLSSSFIRALSNALNVDFPGSSWTGKTEMRKWCAGLSRSFLARCAASGVTQEEIKALAAYIEN
jgi:hypothetical protein